MERQSGRHKLKEKIQINFAPVLLFSAQDSGREKRKYIEHLKDTHYISSYEHDFLLRLSSQWLDAC